MKLCGIGIHCVLISQNVVVEQLTMMLGNVRWSIGPLRLNFFKHVHESHLTRPRSLKLMPPSHLTLPNNQRLF